MRRRACLLLATWLGAGLVALSAREGQSAQPLLVQLPPGTASELTRIVYWTTGPNGGVGAQMDGRRGAAMHLAIWRSSDLAIYDLAI